MMFSPFSFEDTEMAACVGMGEIWLRLVGSTRSAWHASSVVDLNLFSSVSSRAPDSCCILGCSPCAVVLVLYCCWRCHCCCGLGGTGVCCYCWLAPFDPSACFLCSDGRLGTPNVSFVEACAACAAEIAPLAGSVLLESGWLPDVRR